MDESSPEYQEVARISRLCESWEERIINQVRNALPQRGIILQDTEDVKRALSMYFFEHYENKEPNQRLSFLRSTFRVLQQNPQSKRWNDIIGEIQRLNSPP
ncbi:putative ATP synthase C chain-like protein [Bienertia sinuspersici]